MKPINKELIIKVCEHIIEHNLSYRKTADIFGINFKTVYNYTEMIENIDSELHTKVQKCLKERKEKHQNHLLKNLNNIYEEICEYFICGNTMKQTGTRFNSSNRSIHYLFHNYVKCNDPELYLMVLDMIELNKLKSIKIRSGIRKMNIEERINLCRTIVSDKLTLKVTSEIFELDVKTIKSYINSIRDVDFELYDEVYKHFCGDKGE